MERFVIIVNSFQLLTIITKFSILVVAAALDPPLKWINPTKFNLNKYSSNNSKSCNLEIDLEYPKESHNLHDDCPLALDKLKIKKEMLSYYQLQIGNKLIFP